MQPHTLPSRANPPHKTKACQRVCPYQAINENELRNKEQSVRLETNLV